MTLLEIVNWGSATIFLGANRRDRKRCRIFSTAEYRALHAKSQASNSGFVRCAREGPKTNGALIARLNVLTQLVLQQRRLFPELAEVQCGGRETQFAV